MKSGRLLMISTDRLIFDEKSAVRAKQIEYAKKWEEVHIIIFNLKSNLLRQGYEIQEISNPKSEPVHQGFEDQKGFDVKNEVSGGCKENNRNGLNGQQVSENCWVYSTNSIFKIFYPFDAIRIGTKIIKRNKITEITCQDSSLTAMVGVSLKKSFGLPLEIQIHGDIGSPYFSRNIINKVRLKLARKYLPKADKIRVVSDRIRNYVEKLLEEKGTGKKPEIEVRPIFVDKKAIKDAPVIIDLHRKYKQFDQIVLMASRLEKEKNISLAIKSWSLVTTHFPKAGLIIVGTGGEEQILKRLVVNGVLEKSVVFEKWANKETLYSYYKTADLFLSTSYFEGYGMALVEAKTAGCPVVSTDVGIAKEEGAIIVDYDPESIASNIIKVLTSIKRQ